MNSGLISGPPDYRINLGNWNATESTYRRSCSNPFNPTLMWGEVSKVATATAHCLSLINDYCRLWQSHIVQSLEVGGGD